MLILYGLSQIGGGLAHGLLSPNVPMVRRLGRDLRFCRAFLMLSATIASGQSVIPVLKSAGALVLLNRPLVGDGGRLAWQAHLGGALVGIALWRWSPAPGLTTAGFTLHQNSNLFRSNSDSYWFQPKPNALFGRSCRRPGHRPPAGTECAQLSATDVRA
ncbi:MAG: hypothetical protein R3D46_01060 [Defluviimonas denitrificans]